MKSRRRASPQTLITPAMISCCQLHFNRPIVSRRCLLSAVGCLLSVVCCPPMSCDHPLTSRDSLMPELNNCHLASVWTSLGLVFIAVDSVITSPQIYYELIYIHINLNIEQNLLFQFQCQLLVQDHNRRCKVSFLKCIL